MSYDTQGKLQGMICMHVGDLLISGCPKNFADVEKTVRRKFKLSTWKSTAVDKVVRTVDHCGAQVSIKGNVVQLSVAEYIQKINPTPCQDAEDDRSANNREVRMLRGLSEPLSVIVSMFTRHRDESNDQRHSCNEQTLEICKDPHGRHADVSSQTQLSLITLWILGAQ